MSRTEIHKGKATPTGKTSVEFLRENTHLVYDTYLDNIEDEPDDVLYNGMKYGYDKYILINGMVWELENTELDDCDLSFAEKNPDGSFNYFVSFYNGGCGLNEAIEYAMEKST